MCVCVFMATGSLNRTNSILKDKKNKAITSILLIF